MKSMELLKQLVVEEEGQGMTEYGLVLGVIAVAVVGILVSLRGEITTMFQDVLNDIKSRDGSTTTTG